MKPTCALLLAAMLAGCATTSGGLTRDQQIQLVETAWQTAQLVLATIDRDKIGEDGWRAISVAREAVDTALARIKASPDADAFSVALEAYGAALAEFVRVTAPDSR